MCVFEVSSRHLHSRPLMRRLDHRDNEPTTIGETQKCPGTCRQPQLKGSDLIFGKMPHILSADCRRHEGPISNASEPNLS